MDKNTTDRISIQTLAAAMALGGKQADSKIEEALEVEESRIDSRIAEALEDFDSGISLKGSVNYFSNLPESPARGDEYIVLYSGNSGTNYIGTKYVWDGTAWRSVGTSLKLYRDADGDLCEEG